VLADDGGLAWQTTALRIGVAALVGALIGLNRELARKPLGFRTLSVVSIASCALILAAVDFDLETDGAGRTVGRAIQGLMAGVGFLGGGVILHTGRQHIRGLTTAALVWLTAALGIACGLAAWDTVLIAAAAAMFVLWSGSWLERRLHKRRDRDRGVDERPAWP
jgi:putative Mg2+ transporter-C (MgtC) family protein